MGKLKWAWVVLGLAVGCGGGSGSSSPPPGPNNPVAPPGGATITIHNLAFSPLEMTVDAGTVITIVNQDTMEHSVTSEANDNAFTPGAVAGVSFDSGFIQPGTNNNPPPSNPGYPLRGIAQGATGSGSITIPSNAPSGTVIPYFCRNHKNVMATPNGHITVR